MTSRARRRQAEKHGHKAERAAEVLRRGKGYQILDRRAKTPVGEIDLVVRRGNAIAFVEVKARSTHDVAIEAVTRHQARRIVDAAHFWIQQRPDLAAYDCRFDIITVSPYLWPRHVENAFDVNDV